MVYDDITFDFLEEYRNRMMLLDMGENDIILDNLVISYYNEDNISGFMLSKLTHWDESYGDTFIIPSGITLLADNFIDKESEISGLLNIKANSIHHILEFASENEDRYSIDINLLELRSLKGLRIMNLSLFNHIETLILGNELTPVKLSSYSLYDSYIRNIYIYTAVYIGINVFNSEYLEYLYISSVESLNCNAFKHFMSDDISKIHIDKVYNIYYEGKILGLEEKDNYKDYLVWRDEDE